MKVYVPSGKHGVCGLGNRTHTDRQTNHAYVHTLTHTHSIILRNPHINKVRINYVLMISLIRLVNSQYGCHKQVLPYYHKNYIIMYVYACTYVCM